MDCRNNDKMQSTKNRGKGVGTAKTKKAKIKIYVTVDNFQLHFSCIEEHVETGLCSKRDRRRQTLPVRQRCPVQNRTCYFWYIIYICLCEYEFLHRPLLGNFCWGQTEVPQRKIGPATSGANSAHASCINYYVAHYLAIFFPGLAIHVHAQPIFLSWKSACFCFWWSEFIPSPGTS